MKENEFYEINKSPYIWHPFILDCINCGVNYEVLKDGNYINPIEKLDKWEEKIEDMIDFLKDNPSTPIRDTLESAASTYFHWIFRAKIGS